MPRKFRLTKEQLAKEPEVQLRENSRDVLKKFWSGLGRALDKEERWAYELVSRTYSYDKGPGGVTIYNQHLQVNGGAAPAQNERVRSFDQIISKLEDRDKLAPEMRLLGAAPGTLENSEPDEEDEDDEEADDVLDAELVAQE